MLSIRLLGGDEVTDAGAPVALSSRGAALLAYWVLHRDSPLPRQRVAEVFWPDSTSSQARTNLRRELHQLRAALAGQDFAATDSGRLTWRGGLALDLDVERFEEASARAEASREPAVFLAHAAVALEAYRGDLLPELDAPWALAERDRLRRRCLGLLDGVVEAAGAAGEVGRAVEAARRRVDMEPLEESGHRNLVRALALAGDRVGAMRAYHRCCTLLERELGVAPEAATTAAYRRAVATPPSTDDPRRGSGPLLVGRDDELGRLRATCRLAESGVAALVLVQGEAGVGKTRLVREVASWARRRGTAVAWSRCLPGAGFVALAPVSEWLRSPAVRQSLGDLEPVWRRELARLVPAPATGSDPTGPGDPVPDDDLPDDDLPVADLPDDDLPGAAAPAAFPGVPRALAEGWRRHRFYEGTARAVLAVGGPVVLVLDDLQWCDPETVGWLQFMLRLARGRPVLVVATARSEELDANAAAAGLLRSLTATGQATSVQLEALDAEQSAELAHQVSGDRSDARRLHALTGGVPLFVVELARGGWRPDAADEATPPAPQRVSAILEARLAQLTEPTRSLATLAAVIGRDFTLELLTAASDLEPEAVYGAVDELWQRRIIREHPPVGYDFGHDLLRQAAGQGLSPSRRRLLHRRVAQAIELTRADDGVSAALASHYEQAGQPDVAADHHQRAAVAAARVFANEASIRHYRRAAELTRGRPRGSDRDRRELEICMGLSAPVNATRGYASTELEEVLERACLLAEQLGDRRALIQALIGAWACRFVQGATETSYALAERALTLSAAEPDLQAQAHLGVGGSALSLGRFDEALTHLRAGHELAGAGDRVILGQHTRVMSGAWSAHALCLLGSLPEARESALAAVELGRSVHQPFSLAIALAYGAITAQMSGDAAWVVEQADELGELCRRYDFVYYSQWGQVLLGWVEGGPGGERTVREGIQQLRAQRALARRPYYLGLLAEVLVRDGRPEQARPVLDAACSDAHARADLFWLPRLQQLRAQVARGRDGGRTLRERAPS